MYSYWFNRTKSELAWYSYWFNRTKPELALYSYWFNRTKSELAWYSYWFNRDAFLPLNVIAFGGWFVPQSSDGVDVFVCFLYKEL